MIITIMIGTNQTTGITTGIIGATMDGIKITNGTIKVGILLQILTFKHLKQSLELIIVTLQLFRKIDQNYLMISEFNIAVSDSFAE